MPSISVVIPIYNEAGNVVPLHDELKTALSKVTSAYEIIYVDDASSDSTPSELAKLSPAKVITLRRRYGQATALMAGFAAATGELIISMDGDGQNDPADIPHLLDALTPDVDVVTGWRKKRSDRRGIRILTRIGRSLRRLLIDDHVHDSGCTFRVYRSEAAKSLMISGEMHRYILALLRWRGFKIKEVEVSDRKRMNGKSKYGYSKAFRGFIDLIYIWFLFKYSDRPLHLFGYFSLTSGALGIVSLLFTLYDKLFHHLHLNHDGWFFLTFFFFITAIMLFSFGIIIDLLMRIYQSTSNAKQYYILHTKEQ